MTDQEKLAAIKYLAKQVISETEEIFFGGEDNDNPDFEKLETILTAEGANNIATQVLQILNK